MQKFYQKAMCNIAEKLEMDKQILCVLMYLEEVGLRIIGNSQH